MSSVGEDFPRQVHRLHKLLADAKELPRQNGWFLVNSLETTLKRARDAQASGDVAQILAAYKDMKEYAE